MYQYDVKKNNTLHKSLLNIPCNIIQKNAIKYRAVDKALKPFADAADRDVFMSAQEAYQFQAFRNSSGHLKRWFEVASGTVQALAQAGDANEDSNPDMFALYTAYGYAVETLACMKLQEANYLPGGLHISFQVTHGSTRPDIVLSDSSGTEIAWLDITSSDSAGHIKSKDGGGWKTKPYVYELTYSTFSLDLLSAGQDPSTASRIRRTLTLMNYRHNRSIELFCQEVDKLLPIFFGKRDKVLTRGTLAPLFPRDNGHDVLRSALEIYYVKRGLITTYSLYAFLDYCGYTGQFKNGRNGALAKAQIYGEL